MTADVSQAAGAVAPAAPATTPAAVELRSVSRWFGNVVAVNDISIAIGSGITGLLGPNGAGKSTLLHLLSGLLRPSSGEVLISGEQTWRNPALYRRLGLVPERESVYGFLTGFEFVRFNARLQGLADPDAAAQRAIRTVDLEAAQGRAVATYSKGMRQRVKVAAALVHEPPVLLLDEPFNGMDPRQRLHMMELLTSMAAAGRVVLFSSHILEEVERLAQNVLVIHAGRLAASGNFREIRRLMTDRPHTFTVRSSDDRRLASALVADPSVFGVELTDGLLSVRSSDFGAFTRSIARVARGSGVRLFELRPTDESLESVFDYLVRPGGPPVIAAIGGMGQIGAMLEVTVRALVNRRRTLLMLLLASAPVLIALLIRLAGRPADPERLAGNILDGLVLRTVLPLIALVFGTAALGSELEDGTATFLFTKPVPRWKIVLAKWFGAAALTTALVVPAAVIAGVLIAGDQGGGLGLTLSAAVACIVAIACYTAVFVALSVLTSRSLVVGLVYVLIWEGVLAGLFEGTRIFSIRQYAMAVWDSLDSSGRINAALDLLPALGLAAVVVALAFGIATTRLARYQVRAPE